MSPAFRVHITDAALERLREQTRYIALEADAPLNAQRWIDRVLDAALSLERLPRRCPLAAESSYRDIEIRALNIDGFLLLYTIDDAALTVTIIGARHGRQLPNIEGRG